MNVKKNRVDPKHIIAWDVFENEPNGWHRDHIYYGLNPDNPRGPFSFEFEGHITSFRMKDGGGWSNDINAYNKNANQTKDPKIDIRYVQRYPQTVGG